METGNAAGGTPEIELNQSARNMEGAVEQLIGQAEDKIKSCKLEEAKKDLDTALQKSTSIWSLAGGSCQSWQLASTIGARRNDLLKRIEDIEESAKKAKL